MTPSTNHFRKTLESGHFVVTAELTPPRGTSLESLTVSARDLKPVVTAVNLTDGAGARVRMAGLAAAIHLKQLGVEPILQVWNKGEVPLVDYPAGSGGPTEI